MNPSSKFNYDPARKRVSDIYLRVSYSLEVDGKYIYFGDGSKLYER